MPVGKFMRKQLFLIFAYLATCHGLAMAIPAQITYQGTLKQNGVPVTGPRHINFAITDVTGNQQYGNAIDTITLVTQGLFSVPLTFTGVDWENITPYIKVTVENSVIGSPEAITATVYATLARGVVNGSITRQKLEPTSFEPPGYGLVPAGAIMMFSSACPSGWAPFSALDGRFPMASNVAGATGGTATHSHNVNPHTHTLPDHIHNIDDSTLNIGIGIRNIQYDNNLVIKTGNNVGSFSATTANQWYGFEYENGMTYPAPTGSNPADVPVTGPKIIGETYPSGNGTTGSSVAATDLQNNLPPYVTLIFCQKN